MTCCVTHSEQVGFPSASSAPSVQMACPEVQATSSLGLFISTRLHCMLQARLACCGYACVRVGCPQRTVQDLAHALMYTRFIHRTMPVTHGGTVRCNELALKGTSSQPPSQV